MVMAYNIIVPWNSPLCFAFSSRWLIPSATNKNKNEERGCPWHKTIYA